MVKLSEKYNLVDDDGRTDYDGRLPEKVIKYVRKGTSQEVIDELKKKHVVLVRGNEVDTKDKNIKKAKKVKKAKKAKKAKKVAAPVAAQVEAPVDDCPVDDWVAKKEKVVPRQTRSTNPILPPRACKK